MEQQRNIKEPLYFMDLEVENVRCFKEKQTVDLSNGEGKPAQWTIILGNNGTGKTTLLKCLAFLQPKKESLNVDNVDKQQLSNVPYKVVENKIYWSVPLGGSHNYSEIATNFFRDSSKNKKSFVCSHCFFEGKLNSSKSKKRMYKNYQFHVHNLSSGFSRGGALFTDLLKLENYG